MAILIGADLVPTESNVSLFQRGDIEALLGPELKQVLSEADIRIFNLEVPLTDKINPINKWGPNLIAPTSTINGYKAMGVDLLTLANNHILDQDVSGLASTCELLKQNDIAYIGVGNTQDEAAKPHVFTIGKKKIGVYACAEHEFSIADEKKAGANPFDPLWSLDHIEGLKRNVDNIIVLYHGGKEHYRYPSPDLQKTCRRFVDKGADLVICQHSHCIGCEEKYKGGTIVYGQGNFLFDHNESECWKTSLLVSVNEDFAVSYVPLVKCGNAVRRADDLQTKEILNAFFSRSEEIKRDGIVEERYGEFADSFLENYLNAFSGKHSIVFRLFNRLSGGKLLKRQLTRRYDRRAIMRIINYLDCEAHRELALNALRRNQRNIYEN